MAEKKTLPSLAMIDLLLEIEKTKLQSVQTYQKTLKQKFVDDNDSSGIVFETIFLLLEYEQLKYEQSIEVLQNLKESKIKIGETYDNHNKH